MDLSMHCFPDIETIPSQEDWVREYAEKNVKPPGTLKKQESIDNWMLNERSGAIEAEVEKMAFDGSTNHIVCIGVAVGEEPAVSFDAATLADEPKIIRAFYQYLDQKFGRRMPIVVGHNVIGFDMKVIKQRSIILQIPRPTNLPWNAKPWDSNPFDTMVQWGGGRDYIKLDRIARAMGLQGKGSIDGSMVYPYWQQGRIVEIGAYCRDDCEMARDVFKFWHGLPITSGRGL